MFVSCKCLAAAAQIRAIKWLPANRLQCGEGLTSRIRNFCPKRPEEQKQISGRRVVRLNVWGRGKSLDCEKKLELRVKSWHQGLKSRPQPREYDLQLIQYYVKQADQATIPMVNFLWHAKSLKLQVWGPKYMRKSGFTLSINPDKTQHYLSVALFAVKGRGPLGSPGIPTSNNQDSLCAQTKSIQPSNGSKPQKRWRKDQESATICYQL